MATSDPWSKGRFTFEARPCTRCQNLAAIPTTAGSTAGQLREIPQSFQAEVCTVRGIMGHFFFVNVAENPEHY